MSNGQPEVQGPPVQALLCPECKQMCQPLIPQSNPLASEHYCKNCHKSYPVPEAERARADMERRSAQAATGTRH